MTTATIAAPATVAKNHTLKAAGRRLDVNERTVGRWIAMGLLRAIPHGLCGLRVTEAEIERFIAERQRRLDERTENEAR